MLELFYVQVLNMRQIMSGREDIRSLANERLGRIKRLTGDSAGV
jgi:hypothetical protein